MKCRLFLRALIRFVLGVLLTGGLLFLPAGSWNYPNAWLLLGILFIPMLLAGAVLLAKAPELLSKRLEAKETQRGQGLVVALSALMFTAGFILAGLDFRFRLLPLPGGVSCAAAGLFLLGYLLYAEVLRENRYLSRTVEVQKGQTVIDTGLYGIVRHPMYSATILLFLAMPLVLGSGLSLIVFLPYPFIIAKRIKGEEQLLASELEGYAEYRQKVKYRLLPLIW